MLFFGSSLFSYSIRLFLYIPLVHSIKIPPLHKFRLLEVTKEECNHSSDLHITKRTSFSDALVVLFIMTALNI